MKDFYIRFELIRSKTYGEYIYAISKDPDFKHMRSREIIDEHLPEEKKFDVEARALQYLMDDKVMNDKLNAFIRTEFAKKNGMDLIDRKWNRWYWPSAERDTGLAMLYYALGITMKTDMYCDGLNRYVNYSELKIPDEKEVENIKAGLKYQCDYRREWNRKYLIMAIPWVIYIAFALYLMIIRPLILMLSK